MRLTTYLDYDLVALEHDDRLTLMLELAAPPAATRQARAPAAIEIVLDRSASMRGTKLRSALIALDRLVEWLDADDRFGLVTFDRRAEVVVPAGPLNDKSSVRKAIAQVEAGVGSDLSAGYGRGLTEAGRLLRRAGAGDSAGAATVIVISDGRADQGITDVSELERRAAGARSHGITTTTLALGPRAERRMLAALAHGGVGAALAATGPDVAAALLAGEVDGLLQAAVQSVRLELHPADFVSELEVINDVPTLCAEDGMIIELGDLNHGERRRVVIAMAVDGRERPGEIKLADVVLEYVTLPSLVPHTFDLPLNVTVVPADQAAGRTAEPIVAAEAAEFERVLANAPLDLRGELAQAILWLDESVVRSLMPRLIPSLHPPGARHPR